MTDERPGNTTIGGDQYSIGDLSDNTGVAIGPGATVIVNQYGSDTTEVARAFLEVYRAVDSRRNDPDVTKQEIAEAIKAIERESAKDKPEEKRIKPRLEMLKSIAPDIAILVVRVLARLAIPVS